MLYSQDRNRMRQYFFEVWRKHREGIALDHLEIIIARIIAQHPEYHALLEHPEANLDKDYLPEHGETNPFLHLSLHIALWEQLSTGRPHGVIEIHQTLIEHTRDAHEAEHRMIDCLAEIVWSAQRNGAMPNEAAYLESLRKLL